MRDLLRSRNNTDLIECSDFGAEPSMDAENFAIYNGCQRKEIKNLAAGFPYGRIAVFCLTLLVETIHLSNLSGLVVSADERDSVGESAKSAADYVPAKQDSLGFQAHEQRERLQTEITSVDEITQEDEVLLTVARRDIARG